LRTKKHSKQHFAEVENNTSNPLSKIMLVSFQWVIRQMMFPTAMAAPRKGHIDIKCKDEAKNTLSYNDAISFIVEPFLRASQKQDNKTGSDRDTTS